MHAFVSFAEPSSLTSQRSSPDSLHLSPAMADLRPGQTITLQWAERLGSVPSDVYWQGDHLYRGRPEYYKGVQNCEVNFSHAVDVVQFYASKWPKAELAQWSEPENFVPYRSTMDFLWTLRKASE